MTAAQDKARALFHDCDERARKHDLAAARARKPDRKAQHERIAARYHREADSYRAMAEGRLTEHQEAS
jgi:hypothetical protein